MHRHNSILYAANNLLFPFDVSCSLCKKEDGMGNGTGICIACETLLPYFNDISNIGIYRCHSDFFHKEAPRDMIVNLKFSGQKHYARTLAHYMAQYLLTQSDLTGADALVPVPLHKAKLAERGFNQSALICHELFLLTGIPLDENLLQRTKNTRPQTELSANERKENVKGAFSVTSPVTGKKLIVIDDVFTTGSTMGECLDALHHAGAKSVGLTAAKAAGASQTTDQ
jgi:ComF family protein